MNKIGISNDKMKEDQEVLHAYTLWLRTANSTKSPKTVKAYAITMNSFIKFIEEEKKVSYSTFCPDMAFSIDTINEWLEYLNMKRGCLPQTCNARLSALRTFLSYLGHKNIRYRTIYYDALTIGKRRTTKNKVQSLGSDVIKAIINTPDINTPAGCRDSILMSFLYTTACRIDEALSMKVGELNLSARKPQVVIIGKGNKIRPLYITKKLADNLKKYIKKKFGENPDCDAYLFFSKVKGKNEKISQEAIAKRFKQYAREAHKKCMDVPLAFHSHMFRHASATHMLNNGMNIVQVSKILGHESVETTMQYIDIPHETIKTAMMSIVDERIINLPKKWIHNEKFSETFKHIK